MYSCSSAVAVIPRNVVGYLDMSLRIKEQKCEIVTRQMNNNNNNNNNNNLICIAPVCAKKTSVALK